MILPDTKRIAITDLGTTTEIVEQGNIREDMFRLLVTSPLVIADVSIHNANVFYELGIRHGLRSSDTFLLRADIDKFPFDLATDRYLIYDAKAPATVVPELARALRATRISNRVDSPVYQVLPGLRPPDPSSLNVVPRDFMEAVQQVRASRYRGDLRLLAHEAKEFDWAIEGLRMVGRAQFAIRSWHGAQQTFEWLLEQRPNDIEANQRLAEIYHKLSDIEETYQRSEHLARSTAAIQRVIDAHGTTRTDRAESAKAGLDVLDQGAEMMVVSCDYDFGAPAALGAKTWVLLRERPAIVHINSAMDPKAFWRDLVYLMVARVLGRRIVYQIHGGQLPDAFTRGSAAFAWLVRAVLDRFPGAEIVAVRDVISDEVAPAMPDKDE